MDPAIGALDFAKAGAICSQACLLFMRGSLVERFKRCGRPGCHCTNDRGHGPKVYLSVSVSGERPQMDYVPNASHDEVRELIGNFNKVREVLNEVCAINTELLRRREDLD